MFWHRGPTNEDLEALRREIAALRQEWIRAQQDLEDLHRRALNTMRSLRRLSEAQDAPQDDSQDPRQITIPTLVPSVLEARRRFTGG